MNFKITLRNVTKCNQQSLDHVYRLSEMAELRKLELKHISLLQEQLLRNCYAPKLSNMHAACTMQPLSLGLVASALLAQG